MKLFLGLGVTQYHFHYILLQMSPKFTQILGDSAFYGECD